MKIHETMTKMAFVLSAVRRFNVSKIELGVSDTQECRSRSYDISSLQGLQKIG